MSTRKSLAVTMHERKIASLCSECAKPLTHFSEGCVGNHPLGLPGQQGEPPRGVDEPVLSDRYRAEIMRERDLLWCKAAISTLDTVQLLRAIGDHEPQLPGVRCRAVELRDTLLQRRYRPRALFRA